MLAVGDLAPDFTAPSSLDEDVTLSAYTARGPVVLYFYPRDFTPGWVEEARLFRENSKTIASLGATVMGVSHDSVESHRAFAKSLTLGFPLVSDPDKRLSRLYGVWSVFGLGARVTFVMDRHRRIRATFKATFNIVGHVDGALEAVRAIKAAEAGAPATSVT